MFGASCEEVRAYVLTQEGVTSLEGSACGSVMPELASDDAFLGFKASHFTNSEMFILYFFFEEDSLVAAQVGTVMGMDSLNVLAQSEYGPFYDCFAIEDSGYPGVKCENVRGDVGVSWVRTEIHSSLTLYELARFASEPTAPEPAPEPVGAVVGEGFEVVSFDARWEGSTLWVVGEVLNIGSAAAGVELQAIARDASGRLVDVATFWPASIQNIRPGMSYGFRHSVTQERSAVRIEVQIVGTQVW